MTTLPGHDHRWPRRKMLHAACGMLILSHLDVAATSAQVAYDVVGVGNAGNAGDYYGPNKYTWGGVAYPYFIGRHDVTVSQYAAFLNAVGSSDSVGLFNASMETDLRVAGITRSGQAGSYTYTVMNNDGWSGNRPITYVSWLEAARFANWMANGQPSGGQTSSTTENGAYNVSGLTPSTAPRVISVNAVNPNTNAPPTYRLPSVNEWYKSAYYDPTLGGGSGGYWLYATRSNTTPGNEVGSGPNLANYYDGVFSVTQLPNESATDNYLTDVGEFAGSPSFYGTYDQGGLVYQWLGDETDFIRGGSWRNSPDFMAKTDLQQMNASGMAGYENSYIGFRLVSTVPEPSLCIVGAAGMGLAAWVAWRRRERSGRDHAERNPAST